MKITILLVLPSAAPSGEPAVFRLAPKTSGRSQRARGRRGALADVADVSKRCPRPAHN